MAAREGQKSSAAIVSELMNPLTRYAATVLGATVLLAGCGDDNAPIEPIEATTTPDAGISTSSSSDDFIAAADPLCAEALAAIAILEDGTGSGSLTLLASQERQLTESLLADLERLDPPNDLAISDFLGALDEQANVLRELEAAAESNDTATYAVLEGTLAQAKADARSAASDAGFEDCGGSGSAAGSSTTGTTTSPSTGGTPVPAPTPAPVPTPAPAPPVPGGGTGDPATPVVPPPPDDGSSGGIGPG